LILLLATAAILLAAPPVALAKKADLPQVNEDGLHLVPDSKMAVVYAEPEADLGQYNRVHLLDAYVAFKKNWERNQRSGSIDKMRISSRDIEKIKDNLAAEFDQVFTETLTNGGYEVVNENGDDVLLVRPAIINLDVNAPDTPKAGMQWSYTASAGEMTLYIELYDSITGDLIAKAVDRQIDRDKGYYTWSNSVTNKAAADRILRGWAKILLDALDEAHGK
jgi:hypothetical protein